MKINSLNRWSSLSLSRGRTLRNRVVVPPMASATADENGFVTAKTLEHYERLSQASVGLLIVEYTFVHSTGKSEDFQLGISNDEQIPGLKRLAKVIRQSGAMAGIQLSHGGGKSERALTGGRLMAPSAIATPVKGRQLEMPEAMTSADIELWKSAFVAASDRAVQAGFELVELHSAHGYGFNQWLSGITNQRPDIYGGNLEGRGRLLLEIVCEIRARHPGLLISVRIPGQDFIEGGLQTSDSIIVAQTLEKAGVDLIHVSSGIGGWRRPDSRNGEGYLVPEATLIQAQLQIPVIGVGGIQSGAFIDEALQEKKFSLAAVGRAVLQDPQGWSCKNMGC